MLTIQELGLSIMGDSPKNFYVLGGSEFGIKEKYIDIVSFESAVSKVSEFLANQTVFKVKGVSIEYRLFYDKDVDYLEAVPYWLFTAEMKRTRVLHMYMLI